jgi:hypothetical protein
MLLVLFSWRHQHSHWDPTLSCPTMFLTVPFVHTRLPTSCNVEPAFGNPKRSMDSGPMGLGAMEVCVRLPVMKSVALRKG